MNTVALIGNPNSGKSSVFNQLTGLRQKVANFPGVTVEKKTGILELADSQQVRLVDLPGAYSLYPASIRQNCAPAFHSPAPPAFSKNQSAPPPLYSSLSAR